MVSLENSIFTEIATVLRSAYTGIFVTGEYTPTPTKFPCVFIEEADNFTGIYDGSNNERTSEVLYEVNVFSNLASGKKTQCKNIIATIDEMLVGWGFRRMSLMPVPNEDTKVYRMVARYTASISTDTKMINRR